ncbi:hypothetical protein QYZ45_17630 [Vibrio parahaemolyticus]|nr:hypothetical protein [Vibrio parahaemolyticus]
MPLPQGIALDDGGLDTMTPSNSEIAYLLVHNGSPQNTPIEYDRRAKDVGIVRVDNSVDYRHIQFLNIDEHSEGEPMMIRGFGGTIDTLNQADFTFSYYNLTRSLSCLR